MRYYLLNRPPDIGTHPAGETAREVWAPSREIPGSARCAHGWVEYPEPLPFDEVWRYELLPADEDEVDRYYDWRDEVGR